MKIYFVLILSIFLLSKNILADDLYDYKPYKCDCFRVGDIVTYSFYWTYFGKTDFVGIVKKIAPKPTNEKMHWITVERLFGSGTSGVYSEHFLERYEK